MLSSEEPPNPRIEPLSIRNVGPLGRRMIIGALQDQPGVTVPCRGRILVELQQRQGLWAERRWRGTEPPIPGFVEQARTMAAD
jgi:hypothetical protein